MLALICGCSSRTAHIRWAVPPSQFAYFPQPLSLNNKYSYINFGLFFFPPPKNKQNKLSHTLLEHGQKRFNSANQSASHTTLRRPLKFQTNMAARQ